MTKIRRRDFIRTSALASGSMLVPGFLKGLERSAPGFVSDGNGKILVVIQLSGGNDGLNTIVPHTNDLYYRARPSLAVTDDSIITLTQQQAMNKAMAGIADLYHNGDAAILNSVGYPNPNRSHFRSMDIWQTASDSHEYLGTGWVGRFLDSECEKCKEPYNAIELDDTLGLALKGGKMNGIAMQSPDKLYKVTRNDFLKSISENSSAAAEDHSVTGYLYKTLISTVSSAEYIYEKSKIYKSKIAYPQNEMGKDLKTIAELIVSGLPTRVYYVSLTGFDTHVFQKGKHANLLTTYSTAVSAFVKDLKQNNRFQDVLVMTFSEFGRRVNQNKSGGTDHGTANNVLLIGGKLAKKGVLNDPPDLGNLDDGDLKYKVDFRDIYATILKNWLRTDDKNVLGRQFNNLNFV